MSLVVTQLPSQSEVQGKYCRGCLWGMQPSTPRADVENSDHACFVHSVDKQRPHTAEGDLEPGNPSHRREKAPILSPTGLMLKTRPTKSQRGHPGGFQL